MIIAADGPTASGKGTIARALAAHFGLPHLDTGLLYRAVGRQLALNGGDPDREGDALAACAFPAELLGDPELIIARAYQRLFDLSNQAHYGTTNLEGVGGQGMSSQDWVTRKIRATKERRQMLACAGSERSMAALAVDRIAGAGYSLRKMKDQHGRTCDFWSGVFIAGLQCIAA